MRKNLFWILMVSVFLLYSDVAFCQFDETEMALFEDIPIVVTSAMGREQKLNEVSNAMYVITSEEIERSGARQLGELFYHVPGMQVRRNDSHRFDVGVRGEAKALTNFLLVLVDGAVVFQPSFSGTLWESVPVVLEEIDRIEIIRGPGGVLYTSNAVYGVINIITKSAEDQSRYVSLKSGTQNMIEETLALGYKTKNEKNATRVYYQHDRSEGYNKLHATGKMNNDINRHNINIRNEHSWSEDTKLTTSVKYNHAAESDTGQLSATKKRIIGMEFIVGDFDHKANDFYDLNFHYDYVNFLYSNLTTKDSDMFVGSLSTQHNFTYDLGGEHVTSIGAEIRRNKSNVEETLLVNGNASQRIVSYFFHDEYKPSDKWIFTAGARLDDNTSVPVHLDDYLISPRFSAMYFPNKENSVRFAVTKNYRTPSFLERNSYVTMAVPFILMGDADIEPERVLTYELGYRGILLENKLKIDVDMYMARMKDIILISNVVAAPPWTYSYVNNGGFDVYGVELDVDYKINTNFSIYGDYSYTQPKQYPDFACYSVQDRALQVSKHMIGVGTRYTRDRLTTDLYVKFISKHSRPYDFFSNTVNRSVKIRGYFNTKFRIAYKFDMMKTGEDDAEIELVASDFIGRRVYETTTDKYAREPSVYAGLKVKF